MCKKNQGYSEVKFRIFLLLVNANLKIIPSVIDIVLMYYESGMKCVMSATDTGRLVEITENLPGGPEAPPKTNPGYAVATHVGLPSQHLSPVNIVMIAVPKGNMT